MDKGMLFLSSNVVVAWFFCETLQIVVVRLDCISFQFIQFSGHQNHLKKINESTHNRIK